MLGRNISQLGSPTKASHVHKQCVFVQMLSCFFSKLLIAPELLSVWFLFQWCISSAFHGGNITKDMTLTKNTIEGWPLYYHLRHQAFLRWICPRNGELFGSRKPHAPSCGVHAVGGPLGVGVLWSQSWSQGASQTGDAKWERIAR